MKFRKFIYSSAALLCSFVLASCDDVKESDRYIDMGAIEAERAVLLEDFTGQFCQNCPEAHEKIDELVAQYGEDKVIAVSIHCGKFGLATKNTDFEQGRIGLMTDEGNSILESYPISSFPMGVIDMNTAPLTYDLWPTAVRTALAVPSDVALDMHAEYVPTEDDGENGYFGEIKITSSVLTSTERSGNIQFWIVENGIVAQQKRGAEMIKDYVHNNVFRAQVYNGHKGETIQLKAGVETDIEASIATRWSDKERWQIENLRVVGFVSDANGVLQVKRVPVVIPE